MCEKVLLCLADGCILSVSMYCADSYLRTAYDIFCCPHYNLLSCPETLLNLKEFDM